VWFWQSELYSRFGFAHFRCVYVRIDEELWEAFVQAVKEVTPLIVESLFRRRANIRTITHEPKKLPTIH
jgi:hypothetical protein